MIKCFAFSATITVTLAFSVLAEDWVHEGVIFNSEWVAKFAAAYDICSPMAGKPDPVYWTQESPSVPDWMGKFSRQYADPSYRDTLSDAEQRLMDHNYKIGANDVKTFACFNWLPQLETIYLQTIVEVNG